MNPSQPSPPSRLTGVDVFPANGCAGLGVHVWQEHEFFDVARPHVPGLHIVVSRGGSHESAKRAAQILREQLHLSGDPESTPRGGLAPGAQRRVLEHVSRCLFERIELAHLADIAGLSICHFSRAFKQSMGLPPHRYLVRERVTAAAEMIRSTSRPILDIALEVGFSDHSHFSRSFAKVMRRTPISYRRMHR